MFQSIEARSHSYEFLRVQEERLDRDAFIAKLRLADKSEPSQSPTLFRYNPLHDLESLWWLVVWLLLVRRMEKDDRAYELRQQQVVFYDRLYRDVAFRVKAFKTSHTFAQGQVTVHHKLASVATMLEMLRSQFVVNYAEAEIDLVTIGPTVGAQVAELMSLGFEHLGAKFEGSADVQFHIKQLHRRMKISPEQAAAAAYLPGLSIDSSAAAGAKKQGPVPSIDALRDSVNKLKIEPLTNVEEEEDNDNEREAIDGDEVETTGGGKAKGKAKTKGKGKAIEKDA